MDRRRSLAAKGAVALLPDQREPRAPRLSRRRARITALGRKTASIDRELALKRRYDAAHKVADKDPKAAKTETKAEALVRANEELWAENAELKRQVESGDGSLFDLRRDSIEAIVDVIAGKVPLGRFESLQRAMTKKLATLKTAEKTKTAKTG